MCGRYTLTRPVQDVAEVFGLTDTPELQPRYNVAPTQNILAVRCLEGKRVATFLRWGLIPSWSGTSSSNPPLINARSETVQEKPMFRAAFKQRRCLVPADGFYEWKTDGRKKLPHRFTMWDESVFALAGLWETWEHGEERIDSVCLLTTDANEVVREAHDRMPVILPVEAHDAWLDPLRDGATLRGLLRPYPAAPMRSILVSPLVNSARNEGPACLEPAGPLQRSLFSSF